jgi:hypothetical protein
MSNDARGDGLAGYNVINNEGGKVVFIKRVDFPTEPLRKRRTFMISSRHLALISTLMLFVDGISLALVPARVER